MNEEDIFYQAISLGSPVERDVFLQQACAGNPALRASIEALLRANEGASGFLQQPAAAPFANGEQAVQEEAGTTIGPYKLLERIGEGGMGVVYMAEQTQPVRRKVALKVIKPGMDTRQVIARFEAERQALAMMDHANIARIFDAGATESGRPYFVMELVRGIPITEFCDRNRLSLADRLDLFVLVCQAVHHAHQKGIIHRDIKPTNVLITLHDGVPVPKVIDFGIAKATGQESLTDKTLYTGFAQLMGTPLYMSPEQADLSGIDVDTRSDIYSLGVLLYELLTGTTPFDHDTFRTAALDEVRRIIREQEPPTPSTRIRKDEGGRVKDEAKRGVRYRLWPASSLSFHPSSFQELDWITMKALEKDRQRRYDTAGTFAADIARYRGGRPVEAGPPSVLYRYRKFARRNRGFLATAAVVVTSLAAVFGVWTWSLGRLDRADRAVERSGEEAKRRAIEARHHRYAADIRQAHELAQKGQGPKVLELLRKYRPAPGEEDVRNFAWHYLMRFCHDERQTLRGHKSAVYHAGFSSDGHTLVSCGQDGTVRLWDVATGQPMRMIPAQDQAGEVNWAEFSSDGQTLVTASDDGKVRLWDVATCTLRATIAAHEMVAYARFTPDGRGLVSGGRKDGRVKLWDLATRQELKAIKANEKDLELFVFSPDGKILATAGGDGYVKLWNLADLSLKKSLLVRPGTVYGLAFSADGTRLATGDAAGYLGVWDLATGKVCDGFESARHADDIQAVGFAAGDRMIVSASGSPFLNLWDAATGQLLGWLLGHTDKIWGVSVSPDGKSLATASSDGTVKLWDARPPRHDRSISPMTVRRKGSMAFSFTPDGQTLIVARMTGRNSEVDGFNPDTGASKFHHLLDRSGRAQDLKLTSGGALAIVRTSDDTTTWEVMTGKRVAGIGCWDEVYEAGRDRLIVKVPNQPHKLVDATSGETVLELGWSKPSRYLASSPMGAVMAFGHHGELILYDTATSRITHRRGMASRPNVASFSPDGTFVALGYGNAVIQFRDAKTLELRGDSLLGHTNAIRDLAFSPDGKTLISGSADRTVRLWDVTTNEELLTMSWPSGVSLSQPRFAPDGRTLAFCAEVPGGSWLYLLSTVLPDGLGSEEDR
jgi:WD40 repeat protein/serine/threonine protein kinase